MSLIMTATTVSAQAEFWREDFDNGCTELCPGDGFSGVNGLWTVTDVAAPGAAANIFYVSCAESGEPAGNCGSACPGDATLHVGNVSTSPAAFLFCPLGDCGAAYDTSGPTVVSNKRIASSLIDTSGLRTLTARYLFLAAGQACADSADFVISIDGGLSWSVVDACLSSTNTGCGTQGRWTERIVSLPSTAEDNPLLRVGFHWRNNGDFVGNDPSFAVNELSLRHAGCGTGGPPPGAVGNHLRGVRQANDAAFDWSSMGTPVPTTAHYHIYRSDRKGQAFPSGWQLVAGDSPLLVSQNYSDPVITSPQFYLYDVRVADDCELVGP